MTATLAGLAVIALVVAFTVAPSGATHRADPKLVASTHSQAMAGMDMSGLPPPVPKLPANSPCTASACPIPTPGPDELSVAGRLGSAMAAAWVTTDGAHVHARVEVLKIALGPARLPVAFAGNPARQPCGPGCWQLTLPEDAKRILLTARRGDRRYALSLPLRWRHGRSSQARELIARAVRAMRGLAGLRLDQRLTTGAPTSPGSVTDTRFQFRSPNRMSASVTGFHAREIAIGSTEWTHAPGVGWETGTFSGDGTNNFRTATLFNSWRQDDHSAQILSERTHGGDRLATVALMNPRVPAWTRLTMDAHTGLVRRVSLVTEGKFTEDRYFDYGVTPRIVAPTP